MAGKIRRRITLEDGRVITTTAPQGVVDNVFTGLSLERTKLPVELTRPKAVDMGFAAPERDRPKYQGSISAPPKTIRSRTTGAVANVLTGVGVSERTAARQAARYVDPLLDWTAAGAPDLAAEASRDWRGGRYLDAAGNAVAAGLDIIPGVGKGIALSGKVALPAIAKGTSALAMFLGPSARKADIGMLKRAEQMASEGLHRDQILDQTGWFQGKDGQWRFEISDAPAKIIGKPKNPQRAATAAANKRAKELGYKDANSIPWTKFDDIRDVNATSSVVFQQHANKGTPLTKIMSHPELEANYDLSDIHVKPLSKDLEKQGAKGAFSPESNTIYLSGKLTPEQTKSVLVHEVTHGGPQNIEGFASGGTLSKDLRLESGKTYDQAVKNREIIQGMIAGSKTPEERAFYQKQLPKMEKAVEKAAMFEGYRRLAGEVEARNVQTRLDPAMAAKKPWETQDFPEEEQIAAFRGGGQQANLPGPLTTEATQPIGPDERAANFGNWFGQSKVVDEAGNPLTVYHGSTQRGLAQFDTGRVTNRSAAGDTAGTYFTPDQMTAEGYTRPPISQRVRGEKTPRGQIYPANLSLQNPLDITDTIAGFQKKGMTFGDAKREALKGLDRGVHDGVVFRGDKVNPPEYVAFEPTQIKSTGNVGSYDPNDPRIQFSTDPNLPRPLQLPAPRGLEIPQPTVRFHEGEQLPDNTIVIGNRLRSTVNSLGNPLGRDDDEIRNFWNWYGDSVTVDRTGKPTPWYHGAMLPKTAQDTGIEAFDRLAARYPSENTINAIGSWFTNNPKIANVFAGASRPEEAVREGFSGGTVYPSYLRMQNPRPMRDTPGHSLLDLWQQYASGNARGSEGDVDAFREYLSSHGYDSMWGKADLIDPGIASGQGWRDPDAMYAIIPDQTSIKSVFNTGSFNPEDPRIMHSMDAPDLPGPLTIDEASGRVVPSKEAMKTAKQLATMAGSPAGARTKITTRQAKKLSEDYLRQVEQGAAGADWYQQSGRSIMEHMGESEPAAVKLAGAIGVTSSQTPVLGNLEHGVRGHYQAITGQPVRTGMFPTAMGKDITDIYNAPDLTLEDLRNLEDTSQFGMKRTPFIQQNLMYEGLPEGGPSTARAVHDIWDMRARGYSGPGGKPFSTSVSPAQHRWTDLQDQGYLIPEAQARGIAGRSDWDTGRLQASAWVGNKIDALMAKGKTFEQARDEAITDYSHGWNRLYAQHSWESAPGSNTGHMAGFDELPWEEKQRYHGDVQSAFLNPEGQSRIALGYGAPTGKSYDTTGLYEGVVSPGTQDLVAVARAPGSQAIDPASANVLDAIAATHGLLGAQKGAAWNFQSPAKAPLKSASALRFDMGRTLSLEDIEKFGPKIQAAFPAGNVGLLPDPSGFKITKFWDEEGDDLGGFVKQLRAEDTSLPKPFPTTQSGNYIENPWDTPEGRFGKGYVNVLQGLDLPNIGAKFDQFAPEIAQKMLTNIDPKMMQAAGLTGSADIDLLRRTAADKGWEGVVRLVNDQKGSASAKAALLAALAGLAGAGAMAATSETQP